MSNSRLRVSKAERTKAGGIRKPQSNAYNRSKAQEAELAEALGGRLTPKSGAGREKGDVRVKGITRVEAKTTSRKSFSVTLEMLDKLNNAALPADEIPVHVIEFLDEKGRPLDSVAVMPMWAVLSLLGDQQC